MVSAPRLKLSRWFPWFYGTRALGASMLVYGLLIDHSPERGTIILGGLGLLGVEKVSKSEPPPSKQDKEQKK